MPAQEILDQMSRIYQIDVDNTLSELNTFRTQSEERDLQVLLEKNLSILQFELDKSEFSGLRLWNHLVLK